MGTSSDSNLQSPEIVLPEIKEATRLRLGPGDFLAITLDTRGFSMSQVNEIKNRVRIALGLPDLNILILPEDASVSVVSPVDI